MTDLVVNKYAQWDEQPDSEVPTATLQIYDGIAERLGRREVDTNIDRASSATLCPRRRWYQAQGKVGIPLAPRKIVNFMMGDLAEKVLIHFIKESLVGPGKLYSEVDFGEEIGSFPFNGKEIKIYKQKTLSWKINDSLTVTAHLDGWGRRNLDGKVEIIECKSAADFGFQEFQENGAGDYLRQAHACMMTEEMTSLGAREIRYFYLKKQTGHVHDRLHSFDPEIAEQIRQDFIAARGKEIPPRPYSPVEETNRSKPTGRKILPWYCGYCPHVQTCWPSAVKEFKNGSFGSKKPVWVVPNV